MRSHASKRRVQCTFGFTSAVDLGQPGAIDRGLSGLQYMVEELEIPLALSVGPGFTHRLLEELSLALIGGGYIGYSVLDCGFGDGSIGYSAFG
ncbi:hypothetical protein R1sor_027562 [Riccia sorocarpa]|uniref:Uncharacterized protein n=1 Tax=Riccia sorocarpa TaxID=122646 RepID=A0ABD3GK96_9MARC